MKKIRIIIFLCITNHSIAQSFSEKTSNGFIFAGEENSAAAFVDIDNDGDEDLLYSNIFYKNNDEEGFSSFFTFVGASNVIAFADYNGDGFADILFGNTLYRNNAGTGFTAIHTFTETPNAISFADFNNDILSDILLTGSTSSVLYRNNNGAFTQEQTLSGGTNSTYGDIDSDGDMDIIISKNTPPYSIIYENRNTGFVSVFENILTRTTTGTPNLIDFDADGDMDVFFSNVLYKNNEIGFSGISKITISNLSNYHSSWADMDNDGFADLVISGTENAIPTLTIYKNNRTSFAAITSIPNIPKHTLTDFNSDGDRDIFFPETGRFYENKTSVFNNTPNVPHGLDASVLELEIDELQLSWNLISDAETPSEGLHYEVYFAKTPLTEYSYPTFSTQKTEYVVYPSPDFYYWSVRSVDANMKRSEWAHQHIFIFIKTTPSQNTQCNSFSFSWSKIPNVSLYQLDVAEDKNFTKFIPSYHQKEITDTLITLRGLKDSTLYFYRVRAIIGKYISDYSATKEAITLSVFEKIITPFPPTFFGSFEFVDADNDNDLDLFLVGANSDMKTALYRNELPNGFTSTSIFSYYDHNNNSTPFDYNNDGNIDIFNNFLSTSLYIPNHIVYTNNNRENNIDFVISQPLKNTFLGSIDVFDATNTGKNNLLLFGIQGEENFSSSISFYYRYNGTSFLESTHNPFLGMFYNSTTLGDYDNDGDLDIFATGRFFQVREKSTSLSLLYENKNTGFVFSASDSFPSLAATSSQFMDYDNDGDLDLFISGHNRGYPVNGFYQNDGRGKYTSIPTSIRPLYRSNSVFGDYDNDGDIDLLVSGRDRSFFYSELYKNEQNTFIYHPSHILPVVGRGSGKFVDYDNDGDLDIFVIEPFSNTSPVLYRNNTEVKNITATPPTNLSSSLVSPSKVIFVWENAQDANIIKEYTRTAHNGLHYNMYFGTLTNKNSIKTSHADNHTGFRRIVERGKIQGNTYYLDSIPNGYYVWSMQAIDQGLKGGAFGTEQSIHIQNRTFFQSITFDGITEKTFGDAPFTISATATSGLPLSFISTNHNVATVTGNNVTITGAGESNIIAIQTGNSIYYAAYPVIRLLKIHKTKQTITFQQIPTQTVGVSFVLNTSSTSLLPIRFSFPHESNASLQANTVTVYQTGTWMVTAFQNGDLDRTSADSVSQAFIVKSKQTITFFPIAEKIYNDSPFALHSRSSTSIKVSYSSASTKVTINNNIIRINAVGTAAIVAFNNGSNEFFPTHTTQILTIKRVKQSITFDLPLSKTLGDVSFKISASSGSLPISFRTTNTIVRIQNDTVIIQNSGVAPIIAFHTGNQYYDSSNVIGYITIIDPSKNSQTIDFPEILNDTLSSVRNNIVLMLTAKASSSLLVQYAVGTNNGLSQNTYTIQNPGIYTITALQDGDSVFNPAPPVSRTFTVKRKQSIIFSEIAQKNYESTPFFINAYTNAALNIEFSLSHDSIITLDPDYLVTIKNVGTVGITAKQRGNDEYYATDSITRILVVTKADQYFVFKPILSKIYEDPSILLPATTNAGLNIMYSSSSNLINIKEDTLQIIAGGGLVRITAYNTGNKFYQPLAPVSRTFSISKAQQSIHFPQILNKIYGDSSLVFDSVSNKNLSITYTSSNPNILYIEKNTASILRAGSTTFSASVPENNQYLGVSQTQTVLISPAVQEITFPEFPLVYLQDRSFVLNARSTSTLPITYSSSNPNIAYIKGNTVFFQTFGNVFITAFQPSVENYYQESNPARQLLTIKDRTASDIDILHTFAGVGYVGDTVKLPSTYDGVPIFFEISQNTNRNGRTIAVLDEDNRWIIFLDTGKLEVKIYTEPVINRTQRINPAVVKINIIVKITYNIAGRVLGADNEVVPGFVLLTNPTLRESIRAELSHGYFSIENVPEDWTFYLQAYPKESVLDSYYPTHYGSQQSITWTNADTIRLISPKTDFYWNFLKRPQSTISTGNGTIIGKVILDTTKNQNHILYGNFFGRGIPYLYAHIFLKNTADSVLSSDISRTNGEFYFTKLPADYYRIAVDVPGTQMKNLNDTLFLPNEKNTLYLTIIIRKDNTIELIRNIEKLPQTIHFSPVYKYYGDEPFPIAATATSGLPLTFRSSSSLISITENIATIYGAGTSIITAFQSGNEYYSPSNPTSQVMAVEKAYQSITMQTNIINDTYTFSERRVIIKATASSGLPVQLTPSEPTITNRGDTFFVRGIASFKMTAFQKGNENYYAEQIFQDIIIDPNAIAVENPFITIFPNPADDYITIQWDKSQNVSSIRLYDVKGNEVSDGGLGIGYGVSIDIKTMPKGEYIVVVYGEKGEILKAEKVIKN